VVVTSAVIIWEFSVSVSYAVDVLADVRLDVLTAVEIITTSDIGVDADVLSAVMTALGCITVSTLLKESRIFC